MIEAYLSEVRGVQDSMTPWLTLLCVAEVTRDVFNAKNHDNILPFGAPTLQETHLLEADFIADMYIIGILFSCCALLL